MSTLIEFTGWLSAAGMLVAYLLLSSKRIPAGRRFQLCNICGALGLALYGTVHEAWPSVSLNLAWLVIGLVTLHRLHQRGRPRPVWSEAVGPNTRMETCEPG